MFQRPSQDPHGVVRTNPTQQCVHTHRGPRELRTRTRHDSTLDRPGPNRDESLDCRVIVIATSRPPNHALTSSHGSDLAASVEVSLPAPACLVDPRYHPCPPSPNRPSHAARRNSPPRAMALKSICPRGSGAAPSCHPSSATCALPWTPKSPPAAHRERER